MSSHSNGHRTVNRIRSAIRPQRERYETYLDWERNVRGDIYAVWDHEREPVPGPVWWAYSRQRAEGEVNYRNRREAEKAAKLRSIAEAALDAGLIVPGQDAPPPVAEAVVDCEEEGEDGRNQGEPTMGGGPYDDPTFDAIVEEDLAGLAMAGLDDDPPDPPPTPASGAVTVLAVVVLAALWGWVVSWALGAIVG